jgi:hypothetical protein
VQAGTERERLLRVVGALERELGFEAPAETAGPAGRLARGRFGDLLGAEDERLVAAISEALSRLAGAVAGAVGAPGEIRGATLAALDGAELVIATEIVAGHEERVAEILPGAVFLVVLPALGEAEGMRLSRRTEELLADRG